MRLSLAVALLLAAGQESFAQRPTNASICDYYASLRYGTNSSTTQFRLMQSIVALAFGGGTELPDASPNSTGILNPGSFEGQDVNLRSWFDGTKATTNLNNQPVGINWLDAGAQEPLMAFLNGTKDSVVIANTTNEYRLFTHFFTAFGFIFGCTAVQSFPRTNESGGPISLAYVHKYMNLNQTDLGHFINQLTTSSKHFGFSDTDAATLNTYMNARYNVRCAPPVNGQLYSLCQAPECPLAQPSPDCEPYVDIGPSGVGNSTGATQTPATSTPATSSNPVTTATTASTASTSTSPPAAAAAESSANLSPGAISGIAIGGAAVLLFAIGMWLFFRRRPSGPQIIPVPVQGAYGSPSYPSYNTNTHASYPPAGPHDSFIAPGAGLGYYVPKPTEESETGAAPGSRANSPPQSAPMTQIAEMDSPYEPPSRNWAHPIAYGDHSPHSGQA